MQESTVVLLKDRFLSNSDNKRPNNKNEVRSIKDIVEDGFKTNFHLSDLNKHFETTLREFEKLNMQKELCDRISRSLEYNPLKKFFLN